MTAHRDDDTEGIDTGVCMGHSGMVQRMRTTERATEALWKAMNEMRAIFWGVLLTTTGTLAITVLNFVLNKAG